MTREEAANNALSKVLLVKSTILYLGTGMGKTLLAIKCINKIADFNFKQNEEETTVSIIVPRQALIENWKTEIKKWGCNTDKIEILCYDSIHKVNKYSDILVFDECFRGDTEILTEEGYKRFDCLNGTEKVAQFTKEGNIEFVYPIRYIHKQYIGKICKMHLGRERYVYLTPNHNQVYRTSSIKEWRLRPIQEIKENTITRIPVSGKGTGNNSSLTPIEQLYIAIQADGTLQRHQKNESVYSIHVTKERKKQRLFSILSQIDSSLWTKIKSREGIDRYLIKLPKGNAKLLSTHFNVNMGYDRAVSFINEVVQWDGYIKGNLNYYCSSVKENVDFVSAIAVQAGYKSLISTEEDNRKESYKTIYRLFMYKKEDICTDIMHKEYIDYNDSVYCVEVPSHMIVVRSQGYSFISGNCHHLSELKREYLDSILKINPNVKLLFLSATIPRDIMDYMKSLGTYNIVKGNIADGIKDEVLPTPIIYTIPLYLDNVKYIEEIVKNPRCSNPVTCNYIERWNFIKRFTSRKIIIKCTQKQYYNELSDKIDWYKRKFMFNKTVVFKNKWLRAASERLKWLSEQKVDICQSIISILQDQRVLLFCNNIEQSLKFKDYAPINSKNKNSLQNLDDFNNSKINHISSVNMLSEGMNLTNCRVCLFCNLNASEILSQQKFGRSLRHPKPIVIIPYFKDTRDEELKDKMLKDYDSSMIKEITDIKDIKL